MRKLNAEYKLGKDYRELFTVAATKSPKGLWTKAHGFEPEDWERMATAQAEQDRFELAA